jgi:predicted  nucleic acid-binding Zn-ribbon protein
MKSWDSWLCTECEEVFKTITVHGRCPSCTSSAIQPLSLYVKTNTTQKERDETLRNNVTIIDLDKPNICERALGKIRHAVRQANLSVKKQTDPEYR